MGTITINLSEDILNNPKYKEMREKRQFSSVINKLIKKRLKIKDTPSNKELPQIQVPTQELAILRYLITNRINNIQFRSVRDKIFNSGLARQKKRIEDSLRRLINLQLYEFDHTNIRVGILDYSCSAKLSLFSLKDGRCPNCNRLIIGE